MRALITGASSGIGSDFARILSTTYDEIILVARSEERLNKIKKELVKNLNIKIKVVVLDLSIYDNCIKLYSDYPDVDLLINNAGFGDCGDFTETDLSKEITMINTNIVACHVLTKLYLMNMKKRNSGHILNVASIAGFMPGPLMSTYYASKSYVVRLSEGIREELRRDKSSVKISILCPGPVDTNFNETANVKFKFNGLKSYDVAKYAIDNLNKFYIIPGLGVKLMRFFSYIIPSSIISRTVYKIQSKRVEE